LRQRIVWIGERAQSGAGEMQRSWGMAGTRRWVVGEVARRVRDWISERRIAFFWSGCLGEGGVEEEGGGGEEGDVEMHCGGCGSLLG